MLQAVIEPSEELRLRLVCAYPLGASIPAVVFNRALRKVRPSKGEADIGVVCAWQTRAAGQGLPEHGGYAGGDLTWFEDSQKYELRHRLDPIFCTNPLSWESLPEKCWDESQWQRKTTPNYGDDCRVNEGYSKQKGVYSEAGQHKGGILGATNVNYEEVFQSKLELKATGQQVICLDELQRFHELQACIQPDGWLEISSLAHQPKWQWGEVDVLRYSEFDWPLFRENIRENATSRLQVWRRARGPIVLEEPEKQSTLWESWAGGRLKDSTKIEGRLYTDGGDGHRPSSPKRGGSSYYSDRAGEGEMPAWWRHSIRDQPRVITD